MNKLILSTLLLGATLSFANGQQDRTPPKEAISACVGQLTGATCNMTTQRGDSLSGTCKNTPDEKYFVCMPEGMDNGGRPPKR